MTVFQGIALIVTLTALFSYVNHRWVGLPATIGVMLLALLLSLALIGASHIGLDFTAVAGQVLRHIPFDQALMQGMLSFLLFAGALSINLNELAEEKWAVATLAVGSVILSTFIYGSILYALLGLLSLSLPYLWCLLFGALISPTDPVAVLAILRKAHVPKRLEIIISGESLFNDGVGVVLFTILFELVSVKASVSFAHTTTLLLQEALGGAVLGLALGWITYHLLKSVDQYQVEILLTLALVTGGYALASALHTSGPIAIVVAGLLIGNHGRQFAMSATTREHLDTFWELIDESFNAVLFVLIGLEMLVVTFRPPTLIAGFAAIPALLLARWLSVAAPASIIRLHRRIERGAITVLTWGALRGGISVALALSLPAGREREIVVGLTYVLVVFAICVQGLTIGPLVKHLFASKAPATRSRTPYLREQKDVHD